ncbi:hypothetical protein NMG60_11013513 [Bertholletia excelsa]
MGRAPCCDKKEVKRGPWSPEEDNILRSYVQKFGSGGNWIALPHKAGLKRCGKSCRLRWLNYLRPDIKRGSFTQGEDSIILTLYNSIGSRWSVIASHLQGRTDNDVKNYWNTKLKKKFPITAITNSSYSSTPSSSSTVTEPGNYDCTGISHFPPACSQNFQPALAIINHENLVPVQDLVLDPPIQQLSLPGLREVPEVYPSGDFSSFSGLENNINNIVLWDTWVADPGLGQTRTPRTPLTSPKNLPQQNQNLSAGFSEPTSLLNTVNRKENSPKTGFFLVGSTAAPRPPSSQILSLFSNFSC